jgi:ribosomal protein S18 acetylase RimI-like enzyme
MVKRPGPRLIIEPLTPERWPDLETVFMARGCSVARGCWCMYYRLTGTSSGHVSNRARVAANKAQLRALVDANRPPGLLGYRDGSPVGWVSLGPREEFAKLARSPVMKPVDDRPVWSIVCFVVPAEHRGRGVAEALLDGALRYAKRQGAQLVEAYPVDKAERAADDTMWFGAKSMYDRAGFVEIARRKPWRPIVRKRV